MISLEQFQELDIRIGTVKEARRLENSNKLLVLSVDFGDEQRTILAGIGKVTEDLNSLIGRQFPFAFNLEPKELAGVTSEGMLLAIGTDDGPVLLTPTSEVPKGSKIR